MRGARHYPAVNRMYLTHCRMTGIRLSFPGDPETVWRVQNGQGFRSPARFCIRHIFLLISLRHRQASAGFRCGTGNRPSLPSSPSRSCGVRLPVRFPFFRSARVCPADSFGKKRPPVPAGNHHGEPAPHFVSCRGSFSALLSVPSSCPYPRLDPALYPALHPLLSLSS